MLSDGEVIELLARENPTIWQQFVNFIKDMIADIKAAYADVKPDSAEGQIVAESIDTLEALKARFANALVEAGKGYAKAGAGRGDRDGR